MVNKQLKGRFIEQFQKIDAFGQKVDFQIKQ